MTTLEKLNWIDARCAELLALAEKRTPGKWKHNKGRRMQISADSIHEDAVLHGDEFEISDFDATFIASCAGSAEAGWRATRETIKWALQDCIPEKADWTDGICAAIVQSIIAAWQTELPQ